MKHFIGEVMVRIGAGFWAKYEWNGEEKYEDLKLLGKIGYHLLYRGFILTGVTAEDINSIIE